MFFGSYDVFTHVFKKCFYESVINMFLMFFICKLMFLTSMDIRHVTFGYFHLLVSLLL